MDFAAELQKLLDAEEKPLSDPLVELTNAQIKLLEALDKNDANISLQVEEIFDIVKEADVNAKGVKNAERRENLLLDGLIGMNDLLDNILHFIQYTGAVHVETITAKREKILLACGLERIGEPGRQLDPRLHTVASAVYSDEPEESVVDVLESGYEYQGKIVRRATVIISKGRENA